MKPKSQKRVRKDVDVPEELRHLQQLRVAEAAKIAGLSVSLIYSAIDRGELTCHVYGVRARRIAVSDLETWMASRRVAA